MTGRRSSSVSGFDADVRALAGVLRAEAERRRPGRRPAGAALASRQGFLRVHGGRLYAELTGDGRESVRLAELARRAAEFLPGLVPTDAELAAERLRYQVDKDGRELELGILFWGVLRRRRAGRHLIESMLAPTPRALAELADFRVTGRADLGTVSIERRGGIAHLTVSNDKFLNAEDDGVVEDLETAVDLASLDDGVGAGVLRGAPMTHPRYAGRRVFNAGINLTDLYHGRISFVDFLMRRELGYLHKMFRGLHGAAGSAEKPWVAAVDTFAIGGGTQILLVMDHVVAEQDAYLRLPALQEGIIPGAANLRITRAVGGRLARQLVFANRKVRMTDPEAALLCDEIVPADRMDQAVEAAASRLDNPAVPANRRMLRLAEEPVDVFRSYMAEYALEQTRRLYSADLVTNLESSWIARPR